MHICNAASATGSEQPPAGSEQPAASAAGSDQPAASVEASDQPVASAEGSNQPAASARQRGTAVPRALNKFKPSEQRVDYLNYVMQVIILVKVFVPGFLVTRKECLPFLFILGPLPNM